MVSRACCVPRDIQAKTFLSSRVGGIISETNFKFFLQFVSYASVYCLHVLVFMAIFVAEVRSEVSRLLSVLLYNEKVPVLALWRKAFPYGHLNRTSAASSTCRNTTRYRPNVTTIIARYPTLSLRVQTLTLCLLTLTVEPYG